MKRQSAEDSNVTEITVCDAIMAGPCRYTFVQAHRIHCTKSEP